MESLPVLLAPGWLFHHTEQDWKLHEDLFQDACVNHNRVDADNDPATRMHTPLSKSSAEGINIQDHDCRNCIPSSTIVGCVACYSQSALRSFPTPIAMNYMLPADWYFVLQRLLHWMFYCTISTNTELHESGMPSSGQSGLPDPPAQHHQPPTLLSLHVPVHWHSLNPKQTRS